jgi:membrane protease YdiL (CAAX protease family)
VDLLAGIVGSVLLSALALSHCVRQRRHSPDRWGGLDAVFVFLVMLWSSAAAALLGVRAATGAWDGAIEDSLTFAIVGTALGGGVAVGCAVARAGLSGLGLDVWGRRWVWLWLPATAMGFLLLSAGWGWLLQGLDRGGEQELMVLIGDRWPAPEAVIVVVYGVILAPLFEEVIFRGFLLPAATARMGVAGGVGLTSTLFGLMHLNDPQAVPPLIVLGVLLAAARLLSGSLWPAIALHVLNNLAAVGLLFLASQAPASAAALPRLHDSVAAVGVDGPTERLPVRAHRGLGGCR